MFEYQIMSLKNYKLNPNRVEIVTERTTIANIPRQTLEEITEKTNLVNEKIEGPTTKEGLKNIGAEVNSYIETRNAAIVRTKKLEETSTKAGFAFTSLLMIVGLLGITFIMFLTISNLIH